MRTFIESMGRLDFAGWERVLRTMDIEDFGVPLWDEEARLLAHHIKQISDGIGAIIYQEIPNDPDQRDPYVHFKHQAGEIVIAPVRTETGQTEWRFSVGMLRDLRTLFAAIEDMPQAPGALQTQDLSFNFMVRDALRSRVPWLLRQAGPLERWQWFSLLVFLGISVLLAMLLAMLVLRFLRWNRSWAAAFATQRARSTLIRPLMVTLVGMFWFLTIGVSGLPEVISGPVRGIAATMAIVSANWLL